ncbi:MAG TPA: hypothetical protein VIT88_02210 [Pyrinomonadaceae bacterium]
MRINPKSILLVSLSLCIVFVIYAQKRNQNPGTDPNNFPISEFKVAKENKTPKAQKYNNPYAPEITEELDGIFTNNHWDVNLPALPVAKSAAVVVGEVINAQAHLSDDNRSIYSEFTVKVDDVLKSYKGNPSHNEVVVFERLGGRMKMPSGKVVISKVDHQDMPQRNKRYVFFLTNYLLGGGVDKDFRILTAYELRNDQVFPLDVVNEGHPIKAYTGKTASAFFDDLNQLLANSELSRSN